MADEAKKSHIDIGLLDGCIHFWESIFFHDQFLMSPSVKVLVENTIKCLKKLKELQ